MLDGLRVLEIVGSVAVAPGSEAAAAHATRILADLGADVVKLEPEQGDGARRRPPFVQGVPQADGSCWRIPLDANKRDATISRSALAVLAISRTRRPSSIYAGISVRCARAPPPRTASS